MMSDEPIKKKSEVSAKPLFWMAGSKNDLRAFPEEVKDVMGFALFQAQQGGKHVAAKPLKGFGGAGVLEIVEDYGGSTFRGVYTVNSPAPSMSCMLSRKNRRRALRHRSVTSTGSTND